MEKFFAWVEKVGNRLPHPLWLFVYIILFVLVLSWLAAFFGVEAVNPKNGEVVKAVSILSGSGLCNLHQILAVVRGVEVAAVNDPAVITASALQGDVFSADVLNLFCAMLGSTAADIALDFGARDGVYITGGIVPRFAGFFNASPFRERFEQHNPGYRGF